MAVDALLKIDGIDGEAHDDKHKGWIDVLSWSFSSSQPGNTHTGGGSSAGKANFGDVNIVKAFDKASSYLMQHVANGKHIKEATLKMRKAGETKVDYLVIKMTDLIIASYDTGGSGGEEALTEQFSMNFAKIEWSYHEQAEDGSKGTEHKMGWDIKAQKTLV
jgi:type VI secretion system secreted protein Hcp